MDGQLHVLPCETRLHLDGGLLCIVQLHTKMQSLPHVKSFHLQAGGSKQHHARAHVVDSSLYQRKGNSAFVLWDVALLALGHNCMYRWSPAQCLDRGEPSSMFGQGRAQLNVWTGESPAQCLDRGEPSSMFGQGRVQLKVRTGESPAQG